MGEGVDGLCHDSYLLGSGKWDTNRKISPTRGLQQGDPLSPYLFMICTEGLSSLLLQAEMDGSLTGIPISARGSKLSHLFFADDSLIFCRANFSEWNKVQSLLQDYEQASGQKLNVEKTSIFFSRNTRQHFREFIGSLVGTMALRSYGKYLGRGVGGAHSNYGSGGSGV
jgi:hypothetical protein